MEIRVGDKYISKKSKACYIIKDIELGIITYDYYTMNGVFSHSSVANLEYIKGAVERFKLDPICRTKLYKVLQ